MTIYIIEVAILHVLFFGIYKILLAKETQLSFLRVFLISSTLLSLIIPILEIPTSGPMPSLNMEAYILPEVAATGDNTSSISWQLMGLGIISALFLIKLIITLGQIHGWYKQSEQDQLDGIEIRKVPGLQNSFTFFNWIFIDPRNFDHPEDIIWHELGHAKKLHSLDLILFYSLTVIFWWLPSLWLMIRELKTVHEYEADQFALEQSSTTYTKTLVHCTLKAHGMNLASSFDDAPILNRLNFMKKMKKKISIWKVASITALVAVSGAMFACEEELESEIGRIAEESNQKTDYSDDVQVALNKLKAENPSAEFVVIETKLENKQSIEKLQAYNPDQIEHVFITKGESDDENSVTMIVNQSSDLFKKTVEIQEVDPNEAFTIVENPASFPGGVPAFQSYLANNLKYPKQAQKLGVEGKVFVEFIVEKNGELTNIQVLRGVGAGCDAEAMRVFEESPKWEPAKQRGKIVRQKMMQPIGFALPK